MILQGEKPSTQKKNPVPVPHRPPQIPHGLALDRIRTRDERLTTNHLSHGTDYEKENMKNKDFLGDPSVNRRIILNATVHRQRVDCISWAQDTDQWRALVTMAIKLQVP